MSSEAMILTRDVSGPWSDFSWDATSRSTPSMRSRTRTRDSNGSTWMSLARFVSASSIVLWTRRMIGASSSVGATSFVAAAPRMPVDSPPRNLRRASRSALGAERAQRTSHPATNEKLSATKVFRGSSIAT
jgi:hypothetical protein